MRKGKTNILFCSGMVRGFLCLLHTKYCWMTEHSSPHKIWSENAFLQDAAFSNKSERPWFTSWQSWRNFWRSLLSFSLIKSSLAASRFFLCLVRKKATEKGNEIGISWKLSLLVSGASLDYRCWWVCGVCPLLPFKGHFGVCYLMGSLKFHISLFLWPVKHTQNILKSAGFHNMQWTECGPLISSPQESSGCLPKHTRKLQIAQ